MVITLCGATGFVGLHLLKALIKDHELVVLTQHKDKAIETIRNASTNLGVYINKKIFVISYTEALQANACLFGKTDDLTRNVDHIDSLIIKIHDKTINTDVMTVFNIMQKSDVVINLAGESIYKKRLTTKRVQEITKSRLDIILTLNQIFLKHQSRNIPLFIQASATGIYPLHSRNILDETAKLGSSTLSQISYCVENKATSIFGKNNLAILRFGVVISQDGGIMQNLKDKPYFNLITGNHMPFIYIDDAINAIVHIIENQLHGIFNLVAEDFVKTRDLLKAFHLGKSTCIYLPNFLLNLTDKRSKLLTLDQRVYPKALKDSGFRFKVNSLKSLLIRLDIDSKKTNL